MRVDFFTIPVQSGAEATGELNSLLSSTRVLTVDRQFVADGASSFWSVCVVSQTGPVGGRKGASAKKGGVDYREVLNAEDFAVYAKLRDLRKQLAERDGVPPYAVFTNDQLAAIVQGRLDSLTALRTVDGVGDARVEKYGTSVVTLLSGLAGKPREAPRDEA
jgi:superfamily II DNA helicase RecQ